MGKDTSVFKIKLVSCMLNVALMGSMVPTILKLHTYIFILLSTVQTDIGFYRIDHWTRYLVSKISLGKIFVGKFK